MKQKFPTLVVLLRVVIGLEKGKKFMVHDEYRSAQGYNVSMKNEREKRKFHQWFVENVVRSQVAAEWARTGVGKFEMHRYLDIDLHSNKKFHLAPKIVIVAV